MKAPLYHARRKLKMTVHELAKQVDVSPGTIPRIENLDFPPGRDLAEKLSNVVGIDEMKLIYPERFTDQEQATN